jgi:hypothetical protein
MNKQSLKTLASRPQIPNIPVDTQVDSAFTDLITEIIINNINKIKQNSEEN